MGLKQNLCVTSVLYMSNKWHLNTMNVFKTVQNLVWTRKQQHCHHSSFTELQRGSGVKERWLRSLTPSLRSSPFQRRYGGPVAARGGAGHPNSAVIVAPTVGVRLNVETVKRFLCGGVSCCSGLDTQTHNREQVKL